MTMAQNRMARPASMTLTLGRILQRFQDQVGAEASRADQRRDHDHGETHQDGLVDAGHDGGHGERDLHVHRSSCHLVQPKAIAASLVPSGTLTHAQRRQADHRRHGEDDGGENAGGLPVPKNAMIGNQIDECRHGLHEIQHRFKANRISPLALAEPDAERDAEDHAECRPGADQGDRDHGDLPEPHEGEVDERSGSVKIATRGPASRNAMTTITTMTTGHGCLDQNDFQAIQDGPDGSAVTPSKTLPKLVASQSKAGITFFAQEA